MKECADEREREGGGGGGGGRDQEELERIVEGGVE